MFVFISVLSAGRHDATLWSLHWMSASALKVEEQYYSVTYIFVHFKKKIFLFCKEEIPDMKKPA